MEIKITNIKKIIKPIKPVSHSGQVYIGREFTGNQVMIIILDENKE